MSHRDDLIRAADFEAGADSIPPTATALPSDAMIILAMRDRSSSPARFFR